MSDTSVQGEDHVVFREVSKSYGADALAVNRLDLAVRRGEFLTLLGPSGSGKTTALMMLAGFEQPTAGEIEIDGRRIDRVPANKRDIGLVFQNYALFPHMTVAQNLAYPLRVRRTPRDEIDRRVDAMLDLVQLPGLRDRRPDQLSGGQQQRVAVARALIFEPSLVLMDEPLGALDKQLREQMQFELKAIHDRLGVTFVYVTHDQTEALTMSDRVAVFCDGEVQQVAEPRALYDRPETSFVAGFIGENNRLPGVLSARGRVTLDLGQEIAVDAVEGIAPGERVVVSVRPERIRLLDPQGRAEVELSATLREAIYVGDHLRLVLRPDQGDPIVVKAPAETGRAERDAGTEVRLGWAARDGRALKP
ncbi:ABC transporter ATP-binding protein [Psychromarinibacter sp. C21-152]|uniref:Spermidine/putrescine import ATP-binding protein PotA n=1 Tax=Psychromarinibacter sediminicola TaxID=3033385 RepID=A0AAE3T7D5_9RHOB|nr:ABC transporter ATP-binding protein [Psychromarinibacter sediminicola]MDF0600200.1 ABC transporter ATP-binding protein [Psychromarinibacter sediminicola]